MKLIVKDVAFSYGSVQALRDISLKLNEREVLGIVGPNGSGKSTLLKCINRILTPKQGEILLNGADITKLKRIEVARSIGYVPQSTPSEYGAPTVFEVVLMGRYPYGVTWRISSGDIEKVWRILGILGIENLASRRFDELSGGEKQKVLIARALAQEAEILLLDEPTSNLDIRHQLEVMRLVRGLVEGNGLAAIIAIHDLNLASRFCDRVIMMKNGVIFAAGSPEEVFTSENIEKVYHVKVKVIKCFGRPHIVTL